MARNLQVQKMPLHVGDVLAFEHKAKHTQEELYCMLGPTYSHYGISDLEFGPQDNEPYIVTEVRHNAYSVCSVRDKQCPIGWELVWHEGKYWSRVTQNKFDLVELVEVPVQDYVKEGRVLWMAVDDTDDADSRYADIREYPDDDLEVSSAKIL